MWPKLACGLLQELGNVEVVVVEVEVVVGAAERRLFLLEAERLRAHVAGAPAVALALLPGVAGGEAGDTDCVGERVGAGGAEAGDGARGRRLAERLVRP